MEGPRLADTSVISLQPQASRTATLAVYRFWHELGPPGVHHETTWFQRGIPSPSLERKGAVANSNDDGTRSARAETLAPIRATLTI